MMFLLVLKRIKNNKKEYDLLYDRLILLAAGGHFYRKMLKQTMIIFDLTSLQNYSLES